MTQTDDLPYGYRAYGLAIRSERPLPELDPEDAGEPDLVIRWRRTGDWIEGLTRTEFQYADALQKLAWPKVAAFEIHGTSLIEVEPSTEANEQMVRLPLLGPVMALLLHLRGLLVLHASAVAIGDQAVVFMGDKGAGKSTTAAALIAAGHRLLTDDVVAVDFSLPGGPWLAPGFPQMKLDPGLPSAHAFQTALTLPEPVASFPKRLLRLTEDFSHARMSPARLCVLTRGERAAFTALAPPEAMASLMRFSYSSRFAGRPLSREATVRDLRQYAALAGTGRVGRLVAPTGVERLPELVDMLERELGYRPPAGRAAS